VYPQQTNKVHYEVVDNLFNRFDYEESKKYVTLVYDQISKEKDADGVVQTTNEPFAFGPCKKEYFNDIENKILELMYPVEKCLCPDFFDKKIYLQGTKESNAFDQKTVYHIVKVDRCDATKYDYCESDKNIDAWLSDKVLSLRYLQKSMNFKKEEYVAYSS
jgi:predicted nucleic-acid-binding Zn-ribbon protein